MAILCKPQYPINGEVDMKQPRFEVYKSADGWRWRLVSANGRILCQGEAHTREADAYRAVDTVGRTAFAAWNRLVVNGRV